MQVPITVDGGWVVDVRHWGKPTEQRFYVGLGDPEAAVTFVRHALKIGRGYTVHAFRRLSNAHAKLLSEAQALVGQSGAAITERRPLCSSPVATALGRLISPISAAVACCVARRRF